MIMSLQVIVHGLNSASYPSVWLEELLLTFCANQAYLGYLIICLLAPRQLHHHDLNLWQGCQSDC